MPIRGSDSRLTRRQLFLRFGAVGVDTLLAACGQEPSDSMRARITTPTAAPTRVVPVSTPPPTIVTPRKPVEFLFKIDHGMRYPTALATDSGGNVYVIDADHHRIQKFDGSGRFLTSWGSIGDGTGQFAFRISGPIPGGIAVDTHGTVYVSDYYDRIQAFDSNGQFLLQWGSHGSGDGQFSFPTGMAVDRQGRVYVGDAENYRIQAFTRSGSFLLKWGRQGSGDGEFLSPSGIAVNGHDEIVVGDADNGRIQVFDPTGRFLRSWGSPAASAVQPEGPPGLAIDASGSVYVSRNNSDRIEKFDPNGQLLTVWGSTGGGDGQFIYPMGVAVDLADDVYVVDVIGGRIQKFRTH
jgi:tripartite motif-containing protein 71